MDPFTELRSISTSGSESSALSQQAIKVYRDAEKSARYNVIVKLESLKQDLYARNQASIKQQAQAKTRDPKLDQDLDQQILQVMTRSQAFNAKSGIRNIDQREDQSEADVHNQYSLYAQYEFINIQKNEYCSTFPILEHYHSSLQSDKVDEIMDTLSHRLNKKNGDKEGWQRCLLRYIWEGDIQKILAVLMTIRNSDLGYVRDYLYKKDPLVKIYPEIVLFTLEKMSKMLKTSTKMRKNISASIQTTQPINQFTVVRTYKELFCLACGYFDCERHKIQMPDENQNTTSAYCHPDNYIYIDTHKSYATQIIDAHKRLRKNGCLTQFTLNGLDKACSGECFRNLTPQKFEYVKQRRFCLISEMIQAEIGRAIQMCSFNPCLIHMLVKNRLTCSLVFLYLTESYDLETKLEFGLRLTKDMHSTDPFPVQVTAPTKKNRVSKKPEYRGGYDGNLYSEPNCFHKFYGNDKTTDQHCENCSCRRRGFCVPLCHCDRAVCPIRLRGCACKDLDSDCKTQQCSCFKQERECDPALCKHCCDRNGSFKLSKCRNNEIQTVTYSIVKVGKSGLKGLGAFAGENIKKNALLNLYQGELISSAVEALRQLTSNDDFLYNFGFRNMAIDAKYLGNQMRFLNHKSHGEQNVVAKIVFSKADFSLGFYAKRDLIEGEELFVDYDGNGQLHKQHKEKYPFIKPKKN